MSGNFQRTPVVRSLQEAAKRKAEAAITILGKALPAVVVSRKDALVTVKFDLTNIPFTLPNVTIPILGSEYVRLPIKAGCKGMVFPSDASLGAVSGQGAKTVDLTPPANLTALAFFPVGGTAFPAQEVADHLEVYGETGVLIKSTKNKEWFAQWTTTGVTISNNAGTASISWDGAVWQFHGAVVFNDGMQLNGNITAVGGGEYGGDLVTSGKVQSGTIVLGTHHHGGVTTGSGSTGGPTP